MFPASIILTPICASVWAMFDLQPQLAGEETVSSDMNFILVIDGEYREVVTMAEVFIHLVLT